MNIGFDISQTGYGKAGCGYYTHAMIKAMLAIAPQHHYALYPSFGDFFFDAKMPVLNPYSGEHVNYGPRHLTRETARAFWNQAELEVALGHPDIIHANNFWTPVQIASSRLILKQGKIRSSQTSFFHSPCSMSRFSITIGTRKCASSMRTRARKAS